MERAEKLLGLVDPELSLVARAVGDGLRALCVINGAGNIVSWLENKSV